MTLVYKMSVVYFALFASLKGIISFFFFCDEKLKVLCRKRMYLPKNKIKHKSFISF